MTVQQPNWIFQSQAMMFPLEQRYNQQANQDVMEASRSISGAAWKKAEFDSRALRYQQMQVLANSRMDLRSKEMMLRMQEYELKKHTADEVKRSSLYGRKFQGKGAEGSTRYGFKDRGGNGIVDREYSTEKERDEEWALAYPGQMRAQEKHTADIADLESRQEGRESLSKRRASMTRIAESAQSLKKMDSMALRDLRKAQTERINWMIANGVDPDIVAEQKLIVSQITAALRETQIADMEKRLALAETKGQEATEKHRAEMRETIFEKYGGDTAKKAIRLNNKSTTKGVVYLSDEQFQALKAELEEFDKKK